MVCPVYVGEDAADEPDFTYIPETHQIASSSSSANTLDSSLLLLQEGLESGAAIAQFEVSMLVVLSVSLQMLAIRGVGYLFGVSRRKQG